MIIKLYDGPEGWLGYSVIEGLYFLPTDITGWSLSKYKKLLSILVTSLKEIKAPYVYSTVTKETKKFNELFGFEELGIIQDKQVMRLQNVWFQ